MTTEQNRLRRRRLVADLSTVFMVFLIPLSFAFWWTEHRHNDDISRFAKISRIHAQLDDWQLYDAQINMCNRINILREKQNLVIVVLRTEGRGAGLTPTPIVVCTDAIQEPGSSRPTKEEAEEE